MSLKFLTAAVVSFGLVMSPALAAPTSSPAAAAQLDDDDDDAAGAGTFVIALGALAAAGLGLYIALDSGDDDDLPTFVPPVPVSP